MPECEHEWARRQLKKETRNHTAYSRNRVQAVLERIYKKEGERAVKELGKEFKV
jgi:hypothetical protein